MQPTWKIMGKRRLRAKKRKIIDAALSSTCSICGETGPMEPHHPNNDRTYQAGLVTKSYAFIHEEVNKVKPVCRSCNAGQGGPLRRLNRE